MRMVATRLREGQDLKTSVEKLVAALHISAATIISGVGSLDSATLRMAGNDKEGMKVRELKGPFEVVSLTGNLGRGRTHLHLSVADKTGKVTGGHVKEGCIIQTTLELVLAVEDKLTFTEETDPQTGFGELKVGSA